MDINTMPQAQNIAIVIAAIVALSLALKSALGPVVMYITEQVKNAFVLSSAMASLFATALSVIMGMCLGLLSSVMQTGSTPRDYAVAVGVGAFAGVFISAGATESYRAAQTTVVKNIRNSIEKDTPSFNDAMAEQKNSVNTQFSAAERNIEKAELSYNPLKEGS